MKTAISINNDIFQKAEETARTLGVSRSKLFAMAIVEFIQSHNPEVITAKLNELYKDQDSRLEADIEQVNYNLFSQETW